MTRPVLCCVCVCVCMCAYLSERDIPCIQQKKVPLKLNKSNYMPLLWPIKMETQPHIMKEVHENLKSQSSGNYSL